MAQDLRGSDARVARIRIGARAIAIDPRELAIDLRAVDWWRPHELALDEQRAAHDAVGAQCQPAVLIDEPLECGRRTGNVMANARVRVAILRGNDRSHGSPHALTVAMMPPQPL